LSLYAEISEAQRVYKDVLNGYSVFNYNGKNVYIKHLKDVDHGSIQEYRKEVETQALEKGLLSEKEKLKLLHDSEVWTEQEEKNYLSLIDDLDNLRLSRDKMLIKSQKKQYDLLIEEKEKNIQEIQSTRNEYVGMTCEGYSEKRVNERYLYFTFYEDLDLKKPFFSEEEFEELEDIKLMALVVKNNSILKNFSQQDLKNVSVCSFFMNSIMICDSNPFFFYGKSVTELTNYQTDLFYNGLQNKRILEEGKKPPKTNTLKQLSGWYDAVGSQKTVDTTNKDGTTVVGATKEEIEQLTSSSSEDGRMVIDFNKAAAEKSKEKGGKLSMKEIMEIHGH
jgi:hypothetical protein